jgi:hypothetical protein
MSDGLLKKNIRHERQLFGQQSYHSKKPTPTSGPRAGASQTKVPASQPPDTSKLI